MSIDDDLRQVLDICKGDLNAALRMILVANAYYEEEIRRLKNEASTGYGPRQGPKGRQTRREIIERLTRSPIQRPAQSPLGKRKAARTV